MQKSPGVQQAWGAQATGQRPVWLEGGGKEGVGGGDGRVVGVVQDFTDRVRALSSTSSKVRATKSSGQSRNMT